jgi:adenine phosphoribosyltransferase
MDIKALIREIPDFPKPGIVFRDITTLLHDPDGLNHTVEVMAEKATALAPDYIVGIESRGFIFGMPLAYKLGLGFVPVRKPGKLPAATHAVEYDLEYGKDKLEIHQDAFRPDSRVLVVDDLLATGGTAAAASRLIEATGAAVAGFSFVIELCELNGRQQLPTNVPIMTLISY